MFGIKKIPEKMVRSLRRFNAWLVPPERFQDTLMLGFSVLEESYFAVKNFIDGSIHVSERLLYENTYHEQRLSQYRKQRRLVVFVPGYMQSPISFHRLERYLGLELFDVFTYIFGGVPYSQDLTLSAQQLGSRLHDVNRRLNVEEIYLVGHSQGGMIIRTMVQHGMAEGLPVRKCLFLSTPHQGTWAGLVAFPHQGIRMAAGMIPYVPKVRGESGVQLLPGSDFLKELNSQPLPENIRFTSVYYALDPMIWPPTNAILPYPEAENHFINKVGHAQPLYCSRATRIAIRALYGEG
jgi:triacylglycerol esterase/lipase EstA (alpha/beta hydrolase family)